MKIHIVGGGPAGLTIASLIRNYDVVVFEEHKKVGLPVHCTSIVGEYAKNFFTRLLGEKIVENYYNSIYIYTPGSILHLYSKNPIAYRLKRPFLEEKLYDKIVGKGHKVLLGERVVDVTWKHIRTRDKLYSYDILVIAEGASRFLTRRILGLKKNNIDYVVGLQVKAKAKDLDKHSFYTFFTRHNRYFFYWITPLGDGEHVLVGGGTRLGEHLYLKKIIEFLAKILGIKVEAKDNYYGGLIPISYPRRCCIEVDNKTIYFIGDSLPASKPFTGGGLYGIAYLAQALSSEINHEVKGLYRKSVEELKRSLWRQFIVYKCSVRLHGTWIVPFMLSKFIKHGVIFKKEYYDKHDALVKEAIKVSILKPSSVCDTLSSLGILLTY